MILHNFLFKYTVILCFMALSVSALAQEKGDKKKKEPVPTKAEVKKVEVKKDTIPQANQGSIEEIDVIRDYRPILADAVKVRRSPDMNNSRAYQPKLAYHILDKKLDITTGTKQLEIQEIPPVRPDELKHNYAKVGLGNFNTFLGELYLNSGEDPAIQYGGFLKYKTQEGKLDDQNFGHQEIGIFAKNILDQITVSGEAGYVGDASRFYGVNDTLPNFNPDHEKQRLKTFYLRGELASNYNPEDENQLSYSVKGDAYLFSNSFDEKENSIALSGYANKKINVFNVGANVSADITSVKQRNDYSLSNSIIRLNPYIRFQGDNYKITLGANFVAETGDSSRTNLFPTADIDLSLVPEYISLFGGVHGDVKKTSLRDLSKDNMYLDEQLEIHNSVERLNIFAGIKGNAGATLNYKVSAFYKKIEDLLYFTNSPYAPQKFLFGYDRGSDDSKVKGLEGEINLRVSETVSLGGKLNINSYDMASEAEAWYLPDLKFAANTRININDHFFVDGELLVNGQTYAKVYDQAYSPSESTILPTPRKVSIPAFTNLNAGAEYRFANKFGVFVRINNLLDTKTARYLFYPQLGRNFFGGVNYSF
ncbi:TonB dependent receptor [bacterium A37T11]|nr:TonB dependent receptor [bacterium A37T11]